jgi:putative CocE/NonD family hydrolase
MLVTDGILRARYRKSFRKPEFMKPGEVYPIDVDLWSTSIIFNKGHRIRVAISSSNFPRFDANPNTGKNSWEEGEKKIAHNTVHLSSEHSSHIVFPIIEKSPETAKSE